MHKAIPNATVMVMAMALPAAADTYWPSETDVVTLTALGLSIATEDRRPAAEISFGTGFQDTMHSLISVLGWDVTVGFPQECGAGPLVSASFPDGITLYFENDRFAGWFIGAGDLLVTDTGLWHGAPVENLATTDTPDLFESGLGTEFESAGLYGLLSDDGTRIEAIWTGTNCIFR